MTQDALAILRDPLWQFVGVALALAAIAISYGQYRVGLAKRELAFGLLARRRLIAVADELTSRVTVQLDGQSVSNVYLLEFGLKNSGNQPIEATSFERPVTIQFDEGTVVLSTQVVRRYPSDHPSIAITTDRNVFISPALLNAGDFLVFQILLSHPKPNFTVTARIVGISALAPINSGWRISPMPFFPYSHPLNGAPIFLMTLGAFAAYQYISGELRTALLTLVMIGVLLVISLAKWFLGQRSRNAGRYIDET